MILHNPGHTAIALDVFIIVTDTTQAAVGSATQRGQIPLAVRQASYMSYLWQQPPVMSNQTKSIHNYFGWA